MREIANPWPFAISAPRRQQQVMTSITLLFFCFLTLFTPLSSPNPTSSVLCYEPTSASRAKPLSVGACMDVVNAITANYADITYDLTHGPPIFWDWISCPLTIERGGCYFHMDYSRPPSLKSVTLECSRHIMTYAVSLITSQCVLEDNVDGGEFLLKFLDGSSITFSLTHPPTTLSGGNQSSVDVADVASNILLNSAKQEVNESS